MFSCQHYDLDPTLKGSTKNSKCKNIFRKIAECGWTPIRITHDARNNAALHFSDWGTPDVAPLQWICCRRLAAVVAEKVRPGHKGQCSSETPQKKKEDNLDGDKFWKSWHKMPPCSLHNLLLLASKIGFIRLLFLKAQAVPGQLLNSRHKLQVHAMNPGTSGNSKLVVPRDERWPPSDTYVGRVRPCWRRKRLLPGQNPSYPSPNRCSSNKFNFKFQV